MVRPMAQTYLSLLTFLVGLHFGVLIVWVAVSCITLVIIQWNERRLEIRDMEQKVKPEN